MKKVNKVAHMWWIRMGLLVHIVLIILTLWPLGCWIQPPSSPHKLLFRTDLIYLSDEWWSTLVFVFHELDTNSEFLIVNLARGDLSFPTHGIHWRLNFILSSWAKYHDICSLSDAFRAWNPPADCLIHLCLTPTGRRWAGTAPPICSSSSLPSVPSKNTAVVSHNCS